jgi:hypothetical protein
MGFVAGVGSYLDFYNQTVTKSHRETQKKERHLVQVSG